jgi:TetR/AcrR family transcriptional repressor of nem operon
MSIALAGSGTPERILDIAEHLVQTRGFNGFSYADIAAEIGITKASLHYHFPTKAKLGEDLIERYEERFLEALAEIDRRHARASAKLRAYTDIYADVLKDERMCLCGMLAADQATLPESMRERLRGFFDANETWLTAALSGGRAAKDIAFTGEPGECARFMIGALEGAMLLAHARGNAAHFATSAAILLRGLGVEES